METGEEITTLPYQIKKDFAKQVKEYSEEIAAACRQSKIDYHLIDTSTTFDKALWAFLSKRARLYQSITIFIHYLAANYSIDNFGIANFFFGYSHDIIRQYSEISQFTDSN